MPSMAVTSEAPGSCHELYSAANSLQLMSLTLKTRTQDLLYMQIYLLNLKTF